MYPLFIPDAECKEEISSMPDCFRFSVKGMVEEVKEAMRYLHFALALITAISVMLSSYGIKAFVLFPKIPDALKSNFAEESFNPSGLVPRAITAIKEACPDAVVVCDVALDPYSSQVFR